MNRRTPTLLTLAFAIACGGGSPDTGKSEGPAAAIPGQELAIRVVPGATTIELGKAFPLQVIRVWSEDLVADEANWLVDPADLPDRVSVQIRYNGMPKAATLELDSGNGERFRVRFDEPQLAVAPGQAAVVYDGSRVLGGGWIL